MKKKDLTYLLLAVGILLVAGYLGYTQLAPKKSGPTTIRVEKIGVIPGQLDVVGLAEISDRTKVVDFNSPVDLTSLNNRSPFGP